MFDKIRTILVLLLAVLVGVAATMFIGRWIPDWNSPSGEESVQEVRQDKDRGSSATSKADRRTVPRLLTQLHEDHHNELKLAHLELCHGASEFIESFDGFEDDIEQWGRRFRHYIRVSPTLAALGRQMKVPDEVNVAQNSKAVRAAVRKFRHVLNQYELKVSRIRFAYTQKLRGVITKHPDANISDKLEPPTTKFQDDVLFAMWLEKREKAIVQKYKEKIDVYRRRAPQWPSFGQVIPTLKLLYIKERATTKDATPAEKLRADSLRALENLATRLSTLTQSKAARFVRPEVASLQAEYGKASKLFAEQDFVLSLETSRTATHRLAEIVTAGKNKAATAAADSSQATYQSYVSLVPNRLLTEHGKDRWQPVAALAQRAKDEQVPAQREKLFVECLQKARKLVPEIALDAAWAAFGAKEYTDGLELLNTVSKKLGQSDAASLLLHNVLRKDPQPVLQRAEERVAQVAHPRDRVLCWLALAQTYRAAGRVPEQKRALEKTLQSLQSLTSERRSIYMGWIVAQRLLSLDKARAGQAIAHSVRLLQNRKRVDNQSDETMRISFAGLFHGFALRVQDEATVNRCQAIRDSALRRYAQSPLVTKYIEHNRRRAKYSKRYLLKREPREAMLYHYEVLVRAGRGKADEALAAAADTNLAYTWGWLAVAAAEDSQLRRQIVRIATGIQKRDGKTENRALRSDSYYVKSNGKSTRYVARGFRCNSPNFYKQVAASMTGKGSVYSLQRDMDMFDFAARQPRSRIGSYQDRQRRKRIYGMKEKGLFLFSQINDTVERELKSSGYFQLFQREIGDRRQPQPTLQVGRYLGITVAAIKSAPTLTRR